MTLLKLPWFRTASVFAAIATVVAVAAIRTSPEEPAFRERTAGRRAEVATFRSAPAEGPAVPDAAPPAAKSRRRAEPRLGLQAVGGTADRDEKLKLLRDLLHGSDASVKSRALSSLRGLHGPDAAVLAIDVLRKDGPSWLRAQAASVLGEMADPSALPALLEASRSDDLDLRAGAAIALDQFGHSGPLHDLIGGLVRMLDHSDGGKREDAVFLLSSLQSPATLPGLAKALVDPTNSRVREAAADALGWSRLPAALPLLEAAVDDPEPRVREAVRAAIEAVRGTAR